MTRFTFPITLKLHGPILSRATSAGQHGVDLPFFRNSQGQLALPGTLFKGKIREAWKLLRPWLEGLVPTAEQANLWFGTAMADSSSEEAQSSPYDPARGSVKFPESFVSLTPPQSNLAVRIHIDDLRGAAQDGMLLVEERPFKPGQVVEFSGVVTAWCKDSQEADTLHTALNRGLNSLIGLGGNQGVGYGRIQQVSIGKPSSPTATANLFPASGVTSYKLRLSTAEPLCITDHRPQSNIFRSLSYIPGGVIKGALAQQVSQMATPTLRDQLHLLRIRHAQPAFKSQCPAPLRPLSIVTTKEQWHDAILCHQPRLVNGQAPAFDIDWKDKDYALVSSGFPAVEPDRQLTVRTAIDSDTRRAKDENLFAYECVLPVSDGVALEWETVFDLAQIDAIHHPALLEDLNAVLAHGLSPIGKTKAQFTLAAGSALPPPEFSLSQGGTLAITLATAAWIGDPTPLNSHSGKAELLNFYALAWQELCPGLKLSHFFAQQRLAGGEYLYRRFQQGTTYKPWLLTTEGSVFLFTITDPNQAAAFLNDALQNGLPPPDPHATWQNCPYVRENGYGEIAINLHDTWRDKCLKPQN